MLLLSDEIILEFSRKVTWSEKYGFESFYFFIPQNSMKKQEQNIVMSVENKKENRWDTIKNYKIQDKTAVKFQINHYNLCCAFLRGGSGAVEITDDIIHSVFLVREP